MYKPECFNPGFKSEQTGKWYVNVKDQYLHTDGIVRNSTKNQETDEYTGYFSTEEEALKAIEQLENIC